MASASKRRRLQPEDYLVGWVCALPIELAAAAEMLDEEHEDILDRHDTNIYTLGRMGDHNVVLACLPAGQTGTNSAAALAIQMTSKFRSIRFGLMVGIGGGVPSAERDIRLGDVVISQPFMQHPGVVQYDFGKTGTKDHFTRTGSLNAPPPALLAALAKLRANLYRDRSNIETYMAVFNRLARFQRQSAGPDVLYQAAYPHPGGATCEGCDGAKVMQRRPRENQELEMAIHYGTIASGNQVMKDGVKRDKLSAELCDSGGVLCFEMEAAGLMNTFPCLVVRGICDYADSHKNKTWQGYASATAAACAKELLSIIPTQSDHSNLGEDKQVIENLQPAIEATIPPITPNTQPISILERRDHIFETLKFDQIDARHATIKNAHAKTCKWLLAKSEYTDWQDPGKHPYHHGFLWIKGKPGTGKSTLMKFAYTSYKKETEHTIIISFFFNARGERLERSVEGMYRSLLYQLLERLPRLRIVLDSLQTSLPEESDLENWTTATVKNLFRHAVEMLDQCLTCFIDALDECDEDEIRDMLAFFGELRDLAPSQHGARLNVCFSSRHYPYITVDRCIEMSLEDEEGHEQDMAKYLNSNLKAGKSKLVEKIKFEILERASGIFLWVVLVVPILQKEYDRGRTHAMRKRLDEIPDGLDDLFKDILTRNTKDVEGLVLCLQWITFAKRPLKCEELYFAVLAGVDPSAVSAWEPDETTKEDMIRFILDSSKGLAELTKSKHQTVQFIHESVRDYLLEGDGLKHLRLDLQSNFPGSSHDRLKRCCKLYMQLDISEHSSLDAPMPAASAKDAASLRQIACEKYPFLEYSVHNILYHADVAEMHGFSQVTFEKDFNTRTWTNLDNLLERYQVRHHSPDASMLYILAEQDLHHLLRLELARIPNMDIRGERYKLPLIAAAMNGNSNALEALLLPRSIDDCGRTQREKAISCLLTHIREAVSNKSFMKAQLTSILVACQLGSLELMDALFATGKVKTIEDCDDVLVSAAESGNPAFFKSLVERFGTIGIAALERRRFHTAICSASSKGNIAMLHMLLDNGVKVNNDKALVEASRCGHGQVVKLLLDSGADSKNEALLEASCRGLDQIVKLLLDSGADGKNEALLEASGYGHDQVVKLLLDSGADSKNEALLEASRYGRAPVVKLLLDSGADGKNEALLKASRYSRDPVVKLLLDNWADDKSEALLTATQCIQ